MLREPSIAYHITHVDGMLAAVDLDDKPLLSADKVDDLRTDRLLTDELVAAQASRAELAPETKFGFR